MAATKRRSDEEGFVRLVTTIPLRADPDQVAAVIDRGAATWLGDPVERPETPGMRRFAVDLRLRIGGESAGLTTFSKAAYLDLGTPSRTPTGWEVEIGWRASSAAPLFPVFSGWLIIEVDRMRIEGIYAPPGGAVGRIADRALLHVAANGTARWLLGELDRAALGAAG
ncbi:MAG: hypothetical protein ACRDGD_12795 [Candidatus Limnocylindria bacterium]